MNRGKWGRCVSGKRGEGEVHQSLVLRVRELVPNVFFGVRCWAVSGPVWAAGLGQVHFLFIFSSEFLFLFYFYFSVLKFPSNKHGSNQFNQHPNFVILKLVLFSNMNQNPKSK